MVFATEALPSSPKLSLTSHNLRPYTFKPNSLLRITRNHPSLSLIRCCSSFTTQPSSIPPIQDTTYSSKINQKTFEFQPNYASDSPNATTLLFPHGFKHWRVNMDAPPFGFSSKPLAVDFYVNILTKILGNERDAQMCLYDVSWESNFGFCCMLDEESAQQLCGVHGVLSVEPDEQFGSENKDYEDNRLSSNATDSQETGGISRTKLFITGLSFYTSEKTLRSAFEPFGELVEVKVIMDKISKRSKGFAFVEYTTEEAATTALQEMNGKIINGWMIVVDRAKNKRNSNRGHPKSTSVLDGKLV